MSDRTLLTDFLVAANRGTTDDLLTLLDIYTSSMNGFRRRFYGCMLHIALCAGVISQTDRDMLEGLLGTWKALDRRMRVATIFAVHRAALDAFQSVGIQRRHAAVSRSK